MQCDRWVVSCLRCPGVTNLLAYKYNTVKTQEHEHNETIINTLSRYYQVTCVILVPEKDTRCSHHGGVITDQAAQPRHPQLEKPRLIADEHWATLAFRRPRVPTREDNNCGQNKQPAPATHHTREKQTLQTLQNKKSAPKTITRASRLPSTSAMQPFYVVLQESSHSNYK